MIEQRIDELIQMVKAANHQPIRREDFMRMMAGGATMVTSTGPAGFAAPVPPSMDVGNEDEDDMLYNEENNKGFSVQPLNVGVLKEIIMKKLQQKATLPNPAGTSAQPVISQAHRRHGSYASSNHMSASSLHSNQSDRHG